MRAPLGLVVALVSVGGFAGDAVARGDESGPWSNNEDSLFALVRPALFVPRGMIAPAARSPGRSHGGFFLGVDGGVALLVATAHDAQPVGGAFAVRFGYDFPNGLSLFGRYDYLGLELTTPTLDRGALQLASVGARYTLPLFVPQLFTEAFVGMAFLPAQEDLGVGFGVGLDVPISRHVFIDLAARMYLVPDGTEVRTALTGEVGFGFSFASPGH